MLRTSFAFASLALIAGCGDPNAGKLFADIQYRARCEETPHCGALPDRDICGYSASDPCAMDAPEATLSCSVVEGDGMRTISFTAQQGTGFSIRVQGLQVQDGSTVGMGAGCEVTVVEGANQYRGECGSSVPSAAQPCQINNLEFFDDEGNPSFGGDIFCQYLPNLSNPDLHIEVTAPAEGQPAFSGVAAPYMPICDMYSAPFPPACLPMHFRFANCSGLQL